MKYACFHTHVKGLGKPMLLLLDVFGNGNHEVSSYLPSCSSLSRCFVKQGSSVIKRAFLNKVTPHGKYGQGSHVGEWVNNQGQGFWHSMNSVFATLAVSIACAFV